MAVLGGVTCLILLQEPLPEGLDLTSCLRESGETALELAKQDEVFRQALAELKDGAHRATQLCS